MELSKAKVGLVGHSHAVGLLEALGDWREQASMQMSSPDFQSSEVLEALFDSDRGARPFLVRPSRITGRAPSEVLACLIPGGMPTLSPFGLSEPFSDCVDELADREVVVSALFGNDVAGLQLVDNLPAYDFGGRASCRRA